MVWVESLTSPAFGDFGPYALPGKGRFWYPPGNVSMLRRFSITDLGEQPEFLILQGPAVQPSFGRSTPIDPAQRNRGSLPMRGSMRFIVETAARQIKPVNGFARLMTVSTPQKHEKEVISSESVPAKDENMEPLVAFSRPPPMPPVLGPLIALSLFQTPSSDEDNK